METGGTVSEGYLSEAKDQRLRLLINESGRIIVFLTGNGYSSSMHRIMVTAAIIVRDDKVLIARRKAGDENGGLWEFPGGTVQEGESPASCLCREIREELGIDIIIRRPFIIVDHDTPAVSLKLVTYLAEPESLDIKSKDHDEARWVAIPELAVYNFTPADRAVVAALLKQRHK